MSGLAVWRGRGSYQGMASVARELRIRAWLQPPARFVSGHGFSRPPGSYQGIASVARGSYQGMASAVPSLKPLFLRF
jgi:hypothetical protein